MQGLGLDCIRQYDSGMAEPFVAAIGGIPGVEVLSPRGEGARSAIKTFRIRGRDYGEVTTALGRRAFRVRPVGEAGLNAVRVSFHVCNDTEQMRALADEIRRIAGRKP